MSNTLLSITVIDGVYIAFAVAFVATAWYGFVQVRNLCSEIGITVNGVETNSDPGAQAMFIQLVQQTDRTLAIHDDGDNDCQSVYNDDKVLAAVGNRIESNGIQVRCLFNEREEKLKVLDLAKAYPDNVIVKYRKGDRPDDDVHYKIVDDGKLVHLPKHGRGDAERSYLLRDATHASKRGRKRNAEAYSRSFDAEMREAVPARV